MKKCSKCNKEYFDDSIFCPDCGEPLVTDELCTFCHQKVEEGDKFCRHCGKRIERLKYCSKCNRQVGEESNFCPICGEKISNKGLIVSKATFAEPKNVGHKFLEQETMMIEDDEEPVVATHKEKKPKAIEPLTKMQKLAFLTLFSIVAILFVVGFFGDVLKASASGIMGSQSIDLFFGKGASNIESIKKAYAELDYYNFSMFEFVCLNIAYFGGLATLIVSVGFMIFNIVLIAKEDCEIKTTPLYLIAFSPLPYLMFISFQSFAYMTISGIKIYSFYGWGTIILFIASLLMIVLLGVFNSFKNRNNKTLISYSLLKTAILLFAAVCLEFGHALIIRILSDSYGAGYLVRSYLEAYSADNHNVIPSTFNTGMAGYIMVMVSGLLFSSDFVLLSVLKKNNIVPLLTFAFSFIAFIVGSILTVVALNEGSGYESSVGAGPIIVYVLGTLIIAFYCFRLFIEKKYISEKEVE